MPNFVSVASSVAELALGDKSCTQSINHSLSHSPSLFDVFALEYLHFGWQFNDFVHSQMHRKSKMHLTTGNNPMTTQTNYLFLVTSRL